VYVQLGDVAAGDEAAAEAASVFATKGHLAGVRRSKELRARLASD
jgi:hypothetical protein